MTQTIILKLGGMHCASCAMNVDGELEDATGVIRANTSYARQQVEIEFDPEKITLENIREIIAKTGYEALV